MSLQQPYFLIETPKNPLPILISVPHCGIDFPPDVKEQLLPQHTVKPQDTDWFVQRLYDFAPELGMSMIFARFSRYTIDLNRDPAGQKLYQDGRPETSLVPTKSFSGESLYGHLPLPNAEEIARRKRNYFDPYYERVTSLLKKLKDQFGQVLFWDCHSIGRSVPSIRKEPFPDLMLGNQDGRSADQRLIQAALKNLGSTSYEVCNNEVFKGGYLTRHFGRPDQGIHALQLEMSQDLYMDPEQVSYDESKAEKLRHVLQMTLLSLAATLKEIS